MGFTLADLHQSPGAERPGITRTRWGQEFFGRKLEVRSSFTVHPTLRPPDGVPTTCSHFVQVLLNGESTGCTWVQGLVHGQFNLGGPVTLSPSLNQNLFADGS